MKEFNAIPDSLWISIRIWIIFIFFIFIFIGDANQSKSMNERMTDLIISRRRTEAQSHPEFSDVWRHLEVVCCASIHQMAQLAIDILAVRICLCIATVTNEHEPMNKCQQWINGFNYNVGFVNIAGVCVCFRFVRRVAIIRDVIGLNGYMSIVEYSFLSFFSSFHRLHSSPPFSPSTMWTMKNKQTNAHTHNATKRKMEVFCRLNEFHEVKKKNKK